MSYRNGNYTAFYVATPFKTTNLGAYAAHDFCFYHTLKMWKAKDKNFNFIDSHEKTYNVRDDSDWEKTLKPRIHERLNNSKNIILFLSNITKNSTALHEEIDYGINRCGLPIIVVYPDYNSREDISDNNSIKFDIKTLWDKLPVFRNNMQKIPTLHIAMNKRDIDLALKDQDFCINTKQRQGRFFLKY